jgi:hypothetical protein
LQEVKIGRSRFEASLGKKLVKLYLKNKLGVGDYNYNASYKEGIAGKIGL